MCECDETLHERTAEEGARPATITCCGGPMMSASRPAKKAPMKQPISSDPTVKPSRGGD